MARISISKGPVSLFIASVVAGCSINPTPVGFSNGQYVRDYTLQIIKRVRCEARDALVLRAADLLEYLSDFDKNPIIAKEFRKNPSNVKNYNVWDLDPRAYVIASPILNSNMGFDFTFTITETNDNTLTPKLTSTIGTNIFTLGITGINLKGGRENRRIINVAPKPLVSFQELDCPKDDGKRNAVNNRKDYAYPLRGNIRLEKTINTYIDFLNLDADLETRAEMAQDSIRIAARTLDPTIPAISQGKENPSITHQARLKAFKILGKINHDIDVFEEEHIGQTESTSCDNSKKCYEHLLLRAGDAFTKSFYKKFNKPTKPNISISDTLKFSTTFSGGIEPKITYGSPSSFAIESVAFSAKPKRVDIHQVAVGIVAPLPSKSKTKKHTFTVGTNPNGYKLQVMKPTSVTIVEEVPEYCRPYVKKSLKSVKFTKINRIRFTKSAFPQKLLSAEDEATATKNYKVLQSQRNEGIFVDSVREFVN